MGAMGFVRLFRHSQKSREGLNWKAIQAWYLTFTGITLPSSVRPAERPLCFQAF